MSIELEHEHESEYRHEPGLAKAILGGRVTAASVTRLSVSRDGDSVSDDSTSTSSGFCALRMMESHSAESAAVSTCHNSEAEPQLVVRRQPFIWAESIVCSELLFRLSDVARRGRACSCVCRV